MKPGPRAPAGAPAALPGGPSKLLWRWIRRGLQVAALVFILWTARAVVADWQGAPEQFNSGGAVQALAALLLANALAAAAWAGTVRHRSAVAVHWRDHFSIHASSQLGRYLPGKVGLPAVRIAGLGELGVEARVVTLCVVLEVLSWMLTGALVGLATAALGNERRLSDSLGLDWGWLAGAAPLGAGLALAAVLALVALPTRRLPRPLQWLGAAGGGPLLPAHVPLLHLGLWLSWWVHGQRLLASVGVEGGGSWFSAIGFVLAPIVGFLAFFAPAGAGVREALVVAWVAPLAGTSNAVFAGLLSRGLSLTADVSVWLLAWVLRAKRR